MAVKIRLKRMGKIRAPFYRVVVVDARKKRDGRVIEEIGTYNPMENPSVININSERALYWLGVGAQPSDSAKKLLNITGDYAKFKGAKNTAGTLQVKESVDKAEVAAEAVKAAEAEAEKAKAKASEAAAKEKEAAQVAAETEAEVTNEVPAPEATETEEEA